jgi:hypothetical protein
MSDSSRTSASWEDPTGRRGGVRMSSGGDLSIAPGSIITGGDYHGSNQYIPQDHDHRRNDRPNVFVRLIGRIGGGPSRRRRTSGN